MISRMISPGISQPDRETAHSLSCCCELRNAWGFISTLLVHRMFLHISVILHLASDRLDPWKNYKYQTAVFYLPPGGQRARSHVFKQYSENTQNLLTRNPSPSSCLEGIQLAEVRLSRSRWPLERWDRGFESHSTHGCLCVRLFCLLSCVEIAALRRTGHSSKGSYQLCKKYYETEEEARAQQRAVQPFMNSEWMN
jgi:hypothetical protein